MTLNVVSTASNDLLFTFYFGSRLKSPGKTGSARLPRGMKLGNTRCRSRKYIATKLLLLCLSPLSDFHLPLCVSLRLLAFLSVLSHLMGRLMKKRPDRWQ